MRIQHVDIDIGPVDRAFGLASLSLFTAGTVSAVGRIPGLPPDAAETLRETLLAQETAVLADEAPAQDAAAETARDSDE
jgi:hypothetical protein